MAQLSLYLEDEEMDTLRTDAAREGVSLSRYAAGLIREHAGGSKWPAGYWDEVYGCLDDDTFAVSADALDPALDDDEFFG
ncbi:MAG: hypothetical protein ACOYIP_01950 [Coriobacteriales bacterium]|jgi:hypothetical protein